MAHAPKALPGASSTAAARYTCPLHPGVVSDVPGSRYKYGMAQVPIAAGVLYPAFGLLLSPVFAGAAMALSSVSVVTNALRLNRLNL